MFYLFFYSYVRMFVLNYTVKDAEHRQKMELRNLLLIAEDAVGCSKR